MPGAATANVLLSVEAKELLIKGARAGVVPTRIVEEMTLLNGTSDGKIDLVYSKYEAAKAASSTTTYALDGAITDSFGGSITFAEVVMILLRNKRSTEVAHLLIGPSGSNGFGTLTAGKGCWADASDRSVVAPGGWFCFYDPAGIPVDGTHSDLDVVCSAVVGDTNSWDLLVLGRSA